MRLSREELYKIISLTLIIFYGCACGNNSPFLYIKIPVEFCNRKNTFVSNGIQKISYVKTKG